MIGQILKERYKIQEQLGKKAGRRTLLAEDLVTNSLVVIKLLIFGTEFEWEDLKLFEREAATLKQLKHDSIPRYLDYFELELSNYKTFALVQTYIEAKSLEEHLQAGRIFEEEETKELAQSLLNILIYLHQQSPPILHRDIKPSNILLTNRSGHSIGQVYLVDFGSVQTLAAKEAGTITIVGTYGYMPPEQFGGRTVSASDLYSLGATLIYLVTGSHPADLPQKDGRIQFENYVSISPNSTYWLKRLIEPTLEKRFKSAKEALENLNNLLQVDINALTNIQPLGSKLLLNKSANEFQVTFPAERFNFGSVWLVIFAIAWNSFTFSWTSSVLFIPFPINLVFALFSLPFWWAGFWMIYSIIMSLFGKVHLQINQDKISMISQLGKIKFSSISSVDKKGETIVNQFLQSSSRDAIYKIERLEGYFKKDAEGNRVHVPPSLIIWAGGHKYEINQNLRRYISDTELDWLANELSEWLNLPVTRTQK